MGFICLWFVTCPSQVHQLQPDTKIRQGLIHYIVWAGSMLWIVYGFNSSKLNFQKLPKFHTVSISSSRWKNATEIDNDWCFCPILLSIIPVLLMTFPVFSLLKLTKSSTSTTFVEFQLHFEFHRGLISHPLNY